MASKNQRPVAARSEHDPNSSDHVVAMTQLREKIVSLNKQLSSKDAQLLAKDKMVSWVSWYLNYLLAGWVLHTRKNQGMFLG